MQEVHFRTTGISPDVQVKIVYEGHQVKVKVTRAKMVKNPYFRNVKLPSAIIPVL